MLVHTGRKTDDKLQHLLKVELPMLVHAGKLTEVKAEPEHPKKAEPSMLVHTGKLIEDK